jgi:hypothetical protein
MDAGELLAASQREEALYRELTALYGTLAGALGAAAPSAAPEWLATVGARAEETTAALRQLAAVLAPARAAGVAPAAAHAAWRASAALAREATRGAAEVTALARACQAQLASRLATLGHGRRALAAYRPAAGADPRPGQLA